MKKDQKVTEILADAAEKAAAKAARDAARENLRTARADYRAAKKNVRDAVSLKARAVDARISVAKAEKTGRVTASFARIVVRMGPALELLADKPAAVRKAISAYAEELEKEKTARSFKAPSSGLLNLLLKVNAEGWERATACDAARDAAANALIAAF